MLTGSQILEQMAKRIGAVKKMKLTQKTTLYDQKLEGGRIDLDETLYYMTPDLFRSDISSEESRKIHLASYDKALVILDEKVVSTFESGFDHYKDIFALTDRMQLQRRLSTLGLDTSVTRLERFNGRVVYVLGKPVEPFGQLEPQLYIDKETFLPVKWIIRGTEQNGEKTEPLTVHYFDWKKIKRIRRPKRIEFYKNDILVKETSLSEIDFRAPVTESLFDFDTLKTEYVKKEEVQTDETPAEEKDPNQTVIEGLDKIIENDRMAF